MLKGTYIRTKKTRKKMSKIMMGNKYALGYKHTKEARANISKKKIGNKNALGYKQTKEHKKKISKALMGRKLTKKIRNNMSKAQKGRRYIHSLETCKKISLANLGRKLSKETRNNMSKARMGKGCGKLNPNWQGGTSFGSYSIEFNRNLKRKIRKRDKNICQLCLKRKYREELALHHIDYCKKNCEENNLISLHRGCNGKVNKNRDYWYAYFKYIMESR